MINVTNQLKTESLLNSNYYVTANAVLRDGTILSMGKEDFYLDGNGIVDSSDSGDFPIGVAIEKTATLALVNDDDRFSDYNFAGAQFTLFLNLQLSDRLETIRRGTFIVSKKPATSDEINLTLLDYMSKAETGYNTNLVFPCSVREVLEDACQQTGIVLGDATFKNADYQVQKKPENTTFRAVIGMVAALAGGNAHIDENDNLRIITFDDGVDTITLETIPWYDINGNTILDIDNNEIETILERKGFKPNFINNLIYDVDDVVVTGVKYVNNETEYKYGTDGYVITIDNKLLTGNEQVGVDLIGKELVGMRLRPFSCDSIAIGYATFGDRITFSDIKGNIYYSYLTDVDFAFSGSTSFSCNAKSMEDIDADYPDSMQVEVDNLKKDSEKKITAYDAKLKQMNELAANTLGFYYTEEIQADGSTVSYRHDKPTLADSKVIYKTGVDGFFLSVDGGRTWKAGFDSNGDAVLNILYAIGIQSDWINTRGFTAKDNDGNITFRIDAETGAVNLNATELRIKGKTPENVANAEVEKFITEVYSPQIKVLQEQIDGQIEAFFGDYVPDGNNEPASTWTDDTTKEKHLGDLFYIVNNEEYGGQAYRYAKINGKYKWDYVKDTAVVKALADAAQAQSTANAKKRIFGTEPVPPYDIDDLWVQGKTGDILKCQKAKAEGASYDADDWVRASKYTDDSAITKFIKGVFADTIESLQEQLDGKIQTWSQDTDPALEWTETEEIPWTDVDGNSILDVGGNEILIVWEKGKYIHKGDLWQNTANNANTRWRWDGSEWVEQKAPDYLFDKIDGKAAVYFEQPKPPYNMGDFWVTSKANGEASIKTAVRSRADGAFTDTDWIDFKYADKTDIDNAVKEYDTSLGQNEVFNKLTNGGEDQGIYMQNGHLYINASYIKSGQISADLINLKNINVTNGSGISTFAIDNYGNVTLRPNTFVLTNGDTIYSVAEDKASTALSSANRYTDKALGDLDIGKMSKQEIIDVLSDNSSNKGLYLSNGDVYMNADYINTGELAGWIVDAANKTLKSYGTKNGGAVELNGEDGYIYAESNLSYYISGYGMVYGTSIEGATIETGGIYAAGLTVNKVTTSDISTGIIDVTKTITAGGIIKSNSHIEAWNNGHFYCVGTGTDLADASIRGKLKVSGTKSRSVSTVDYDEQLFYCYEMPTPFFGDIGESVISDDGTCMIDIDDIFQESANVGIKYYVFLQREGEGDCWVAEKEQNYFVVKGTPGLKFSFEIKARQIEYEHMRFTDPGDTAYTDARDIEIPEPNYESEETEVSEPDYESELINDRLSIINQMEVIS